MNTVGHKQLNNIMLGECGVERPLNSQQASCGINKSFITKDEDTLKFNKCPYTHKISEVSKINCFKFLNESLFS